MKDGKVAKVVRYLLGLALLFFGLNGFFLFFTPPELSGAGGAFFGALIATGYLMPLTNIVFLLVAVMLLTNRYVPLGLVLLAPIMVNVVLFHIFLDVASGIGGYVVALFNLYLMIVNVDAYRPMLRKK